LLMTQSGWADAEKQYLVWRGRDGDARDMIGDVTGHRRGEAGGREAGDALPCSLTR
jgi:hypothetical protein